ncbi:fibrous sheath CABYR-binding protein-like, partial [Aphis craccivora]
PLLTPALSTVPITTEIKAVETDPDAPAESVTSIDSEAPARDANLEFVCRLEEVQSITLGPYWSQPITPEAVEEPPYDDDNREVAFISGLGGETVRRRQKNRRFLSVVRSAIRRAFRAVCCRCKRNKQKKTERQMSDSSDGGGSSGADSGK